MSGGGAAAGVTAGFIVATTEFHVLSHGAIVVGIIPTLVVIMGWWSTRRTADLQR
ncbi:uncharacterized protein METZ01_LOCUS35434 [marine metagenome]|uniref:Uncharacterized protein n=1 Tax=marine metagenome TaxID=408172 RepID=A0A381QTX3_9ZZZZ